MNTLDNTNIEFLEDRIVKIKDLFCNDYVIEAIKLVKETGSI